MGKWNGSGLFSKASKQSAKQLLKCHPGNMCRCILEDFLQKCSTCRAECIPKALFAHVHKKPSCQIFGLNVQQGTRYQAESQQEGIAQQFQDHQLSSQIPQDCILQECQAKALRTASGNLSHPQMFTRLDKWSCRPTFAEVKALHYAVMSST